MSIKANLIGGANGNLEAEVLSGLSAEVPRPSGLYVYQSPYEIEVNRQAYAINDTTGNDMAVNGAVGGATDGIHDGTDSALWTGTGADFTFNSTAQANTGTRSIDATASSNGDTALFTRASAVSVSTYASITGFIYIDSWATTGTKDVTLQFRLSGATVSSVVNLSDFIDVTAAGSWQAFIIPLTEFGISSATVDELVITTIDIGPGQPPNYYLDDLELTEGSGTIFTIEPPNGKVLRVYGFSWTIVDNTTIALTNGTTTGLSYNKFGSLTELTNGVLTRRIQYGDTRFSNVVTKHSDIISGSNARLLDSWDDGTNTLLKFYTRFAAPVDLSPNGNDRYEFVVQDDLSSLIEFNIRADAALVTRPDGETL